jgi:hypothetical protein
VPRVSALVAPASLALSLVAVRATAAMNDRDVGRPIFIHPPGGHGRILDPVGCHSPASHRMNCLLWPMCVLMVSCE